MPEDMFATIQSYVLGSFEAGTWISQNESQLCVSTRTSRPSSSGLGSLYDNIRVARDLFQRGAAEEAGLHLLRGVSLIHSIIYTQQPYALAHLVRMIVYLIMRDRYRIAFELCKDLARTAAMVYSKRYPLNGIFARLYSLLRMPA